MSKKNSSAKRSWLGRLFFGGSKGLADDIEAKRAAKNDVEEIVSPVKQIVRGFMERKLAVGALLRGHRHVPAGLHRPAVHDDLH